MAIEEIKIMLETLSNFFNRASDFPTTYRINKQFIDNHLAVLKKPNRISAADLLNNIINTLTLVAQFKKDSSWIDAPLMSATKKNLGEWIDLLRSSDYRNEYAKEMGISRVTSLAAHMLYFKKIGTPEVKTELKASTGAAAVSDSKEAVDAVVVFSPTS